MNQQNRLLPNNFQLQNGKEIEGRVLNILENLIQKYLKSSKIQMTIAQ